ncbi:MAG: TerB family tellurite resistance protein [Deltaproteobacteria bacterium]|nr:TerB family tellurite resistance protein [Deltaproteobacteria bacterium]
MKGFKRMQFRLAYSMAAADGTLSTSEEQILKVLAQAYEIESEEVVQLKKEASQIDLKALKTVVPYKKNRMELLETACLMAMADGQAQPEEWRMSIDICTALDLTRNDAQTCVRRARRRLISLAKQHGLVHELRQNLKRNGVL